MNKTPTTLLLLGAQRWGRQPIIEMANAEGWVVVLLIPKGERVTLSDREKSPLAEMITISKNPGTKTLEKIAGKISSAYDNNWCVLALDDYCAGLGAAISQHASTSNYTPKAAEAVFEKHRLRALFDEIRKSQHKLPLQEIPYAYLNYPSHEKDALPEILHGDAMQIKQGSFIIKPNAYAGSVGVLAATSRKELRDLIPIAREQLAAEQFQETMKGIHIQPGIIIEQQVPRKKGLGFCAEFTCHVMSIQGKHQVIGISEKLINTDTFIENGHVFPSPHFPVDLYTPLLDTVMALLDKLEVKNTMSNWEFIVTPKNKLALVEGHLRPSGDTLMELIEQATGVHPYKAFLQALQGKGIPSFKPIQTAGIFWLSPSQPLEKVDAIHLPDNLPKEVKLKLKRKALFNARYWPGPTSWYERYIAIVINGENLEAIRKNGLKAIKKIKLEGVDHQNEKVTSTLILPALQP